MDTSLTFSYGHLFQASWNVGRVLWDSLGKGGTTSAKVTPSLFFFRTGERSTEDGLLGDLLHVWLTKAKSGSSGSSALERDSVDVLLVFSYGMYPKESQHM